MLPFLGLVYLTVARLSQGNLSATTTKNFYHPNQHSIKQAQLVQLDHCEGVYSNY